MMIVSQKQLEKIVMESVRCVLVEMGAQYWDGGDFVVKFLGRDQILPLADQLWNMLEASYSNIGGLRTYRDKTNFIGMARFAKVVYDGDDLVACATYRRIDDSYKMVAIGCEQTERGKSAIQMLVRDDISSCDMRFWAEVSGAIEHYFKKHNGYPMPNTLAPLILGMDECSIEISETDKVHYTRMISGERFQKMIFGIKSQEIFDAVLREVEDYSSFMKSVNNISESAVKGHKYGVKQAVFIIENIYRAHEEDGFNEMVPIWYEAILESLDILCNSERTNLVKDYIEYAEYLLTVMPVLKLNALSLNNLPYPGHNIGSNAV